MQISKRAAVVALAVAALGGSAATAVTAAGHDGGGGDRHGNGVRRNDGEHHRGEALVETTLAPSVPAPTDPAIEGVNPGGVPWVLQRGEARLRHDGDLRVEISGLLIPSGQFAGTTGPVHTVTASLYCGGTVAGTTAQFPLSAQGDAELEGMMTVPAKCLQPTVLVHPNGMNAYIAASGFGG